MWLLRQLYRTKKRETVSKNTPIQIAKEIQRLLGNGAISRNKIVESLPYPENEVIESLRFLQDEGFITACEDGIHYKINNRRYSGIIKIK